MNWKKTPVSLGIYFGSQVLTAVEVDSKKIITSITTPIPASQSTETLDKGREDSVLIALLSAEFKKLKNPNTPATISLPGKDFIIRTFELPIMPSDELTSAVNFEAKKYIPFKLEELMYDFQVQLDRVNRRNVVLFAGIKKDVLTRYQFILGQAGIKCAFVEYSAFSVLRLLDLLHISNKGIIALFNVDMKEEDEVDFLVLENGLPLFSRDIPLVSRASTEGLKVEANSSDQAFEKLKTEIRISADYYQRKFPLKRIEKFYFITGSNYRSQLEGFVKEIGFAAEFVDVSKYVAEAGSILNLSFLRSYGAALSASLKSNLKLDVINPKHKAATVRKAVVKGAAGSGGGLLPTDIRVNPKAIIAGVVICALAFLIGIYRLKPVEEGLNNVISSRPVVTTVSVDLSQEELVNIDTSYKKKIKELEQLIKKQLFITGILDGLPRIIPEGLWLKDFVFRKDDSVAELVFRGTAYAGDSEQEMGLVNTFLASLRGLPVFSEYFKEININAVEQSKTSGVMMTNFEITCKGGKN